MPLGAGEMIEENLNGQDEAAERAAELGRYALLLELETRGGIVCELCTDLRSDGDAMFRAALPAVPLDRPECAASSKRARGNRGTNRGGRVVAR